MNMKNEQIRKLIRKLSLRYGEQDQDVQRLVAELHVMESFEFRYPEKLAVLVRSLEFRTRAKQRYLVAQ